MGLNIVGMYVVVGMAEKTADSAVTDHADQGKIVVDMNAGSCDRKQIEGNDGDCGDMSSGTMDGVDYIDLVLGISARHSTHHVHMK